MIRRIVLAIFTVGFLVCAFAGEADALRGRHSTQISLDNVSSASGTGLVVSGDLSSSYRKCTKYRRVGLWLGDTQIDTALSNAYGNFTLKGSAAVPGTYTVYAYREYAVGQCGHLCKLAQVNVTYSG